MKLARVALLLTIFFLLFLNPVLPQSNNDEEDDDDTGGVYPTEYQGGGTNTIDPNREELGSYGTLPKSDFTQQLHISSQTQDEIRPNYFVLEGYVDITHQGIRLQ
jgi:hypothetical protein